MIELNLKGLMAYVSATFETLSKVLNSTYKIIGELMEEYKTILAKERSYYKLLAMNMKVKGYIDWFRPNNEGKHFFLAVKLT